MNRDKCKTLHVVYRGQRTQTANIVQRWEPPAGVVTLPPHDPETGHEWGDYSFGSFNLAYSILRDFTANHEAAHRYAKYFVYDYLRDWRDPWEISGADIAAWLMQLDGHVWAKQ